MISNFLSKFTEKKGKLSNDEVISLGPSHDKTNLKDNNKKSK